MTDCIFCKIIAGEIPSAKVYEDELRTIINTGPGGGQEVDHLHIHLLGGKDLPGFH